MKRKAVVDSRTKIVANVVAWDGVSAFRDPAGCYSVECDPYVQKGDEHVEGATFIKQYDAPKPPPTPEEQALIDRLALDRNELLALKGDAAIQTLLDMTPEQILTWAQNNTPLTPANLARLIYMVQSALRPRVR